MVEVHLSNIGKKYYNEWVFRHANIQIHSGQKSVLLGPNGSGKSTLIQVIAGAIMPNEGVVTYQHEGKSIESDQVFKHLSFAAPYLELLEEFTLREIIRLHFSFKCLVKSFSGEEVLFRSGLEKQADQVFKYFSSGMKQRVKLALAFYSDTPLLILDEPCSNLDSKGIEWYKQNIDEFTGSRTVVVASNQNKAEYFFCDSEIQISDYK